MSNMDSFNNSNSNEPPSKAIMESGHGLEMYRKNGDEERGDSKYLQRHSATIQEPSNTLSNKTQWSSESMDGKDIKWDHITNHNFSRWAVLHIFGELLPKEEKNKKKNKGKNKEKNKDKNEEEKGEKKNEKKEEKETRSISISTPDPVSKLDENFRAGPQLHKTSNHGECILKGKSSKDNINLYWSISYSSRTRRQNFLSHDSQLEPFPTKSEWNDKSKSNSMRVWELHRNNPLDSPIQVGVRYSNQNMHNQCAKENNGRSLSELPSLPDYICEHFDKNNHFGFHQITDKNSLEFVDDEYLKYLNEKFGITEFQPVFVDQSEYVIWLLDQKGNMYEWNEMQQNLLYMGKDLIEGLTNNFIHPEKICQVMNDGKQVPIMEFKHQMKARAERMWKDREFL